LEFTSNQINFNLGIKNYDHNRTRHQAPSLIIVIFLALGILGVFGYYQLRYELIPSMNIRGSA